MNKETWQMTEQEQTFDILKNPKKYEHKAKISELVELISAGCGLVNQNPEVFDYTTFREPLERLLKLCVDRDWRLDQEEAE